jgi:hypothetical protein
MVPVPCKPKLPMAITNSRGVLCANVAGKLFARIARSAIADELGPRQLGAIKNGGTVYPSMAVRTFLAQSRLTGVPSAVLFVDISAAFYSVLPETVLGELMTHPSNAAALSAAASMTRRPRPSNKSASGAGHSWKGKGFPPSGGGG